MNNSLFLIYINLYTLSIALIPMFLIHTFMFYKKMSRKKIFIILLSAFAILPLISFICYKKIFAVSFIESLTKNGLLYIFAYGGLIAVNYIVYLTLKYIEIKQESNLVPHSPASAEPDIKRQSFQGVKFIISFVLLIFMIYLSIPTFLTVISSRTMNKNIEKLAVKLSVFPNQKNAIVLYNSQNLVDIYLYPKN